MTTLTRVATLVLLWLLAWGEASLANVLSGIVVAVVLLVAFRPAQHRSSDVRLSPSGTARILGYVIRQLGTSNLVMARQILRPTQAAPGVLVHHLGRPSDEVITVMSSVIALSPGTMTVDVGSDSSTIYIHFFHLDDVESARRSLARLEVLSVAALQGRRRVQPQHPTVEEAP